MAWKLRSSMQASDATQTLDPALSAPGLDRTPVRHRPRRLSHNGSSHSASDVANRLEGQGMTRIRGAPRPPQDPGR